MSLLPRIITALVGWSANRFYHLEVRGRGVPSGPVLVVANHPNALLDPLIVFRAAGRVVRPLAKEPLFRQPLIGPVLRALGGLPIYRRQDNPALMQQNEQTFAAAIRALHAGAAVQIYPEGQSHSEPHLTRLKTGAARIALRAEAEAGWNLGLKVTPVGLTYEHKTLFRGRAAACIGESFEVTPWREMYDSDSQAAVSALMAEIERRLEALTLNLTQQEDLELIDSAERLYVREKGLASWRDVEGPGRRLPRMQLFAHGLAWLRAHDPPRHQRLTRAVQQYRKRALLLGAADADVPPRYPAAGVVRYALREALVLGIGLPLALLGLLFWYPPYALNRAIVKRLRVDETGIATYKLGLALLLMPLTLAVWVTVALVAAGWKLASLVAVAMALLGGVLQSWSGRWQKVKQDAALFARTIRHPRQHDRLRRERQALVHEFDEIMSLMQ